MKILITESQYFYLRRRQEIEDMVKERLQRPSLRSILSFTPTKKRFIKHFSQVLGEKLAKIYSNEKTEFEDFKAMASDIANYITIHYSDLIGNWYEENTNQ